MRVDDLFIKFVTLRCARFSHSTTTHLNWSKLGILEMIAARSSSVAAVEQSDILKPDWRE